MYFLIYCICLVFFFTPWFGVKKNTLRGKKNTTFIYIFSVFYYPNSVFYYPIMMFFVFWYYSNKLLNAAHFWLQNKPKIWDAWIACSDFYLEWTTSTMLWKFVFYLFFKFWFTDLFFQLSIFNKLYLLA